jgi:hypothetical protein
MVGKFKVAVQHALRFCDFASCLHAVTGSGHVGKQSRPCDRDWPAGVVVWGNCLQGVECTDFMLDS